MCNIFVLEYSMGGGSYRPDLHEVCMMGLVHDVFWAYNIQL